MADADALNPKDAIGRSKPGLNCMPIAPLFQAGQVMKGGADKYGRYNWRDAKISASVYFDATLRHLCAWWGGAENDPESGLPHLAHVIANMTLVLDAQAHDCMTDDRP